MIYLWTCDYLTYRISSAHKACIFLCNNLLVQQIMDKTVRSLLRLSSSLRKLSTLSSYSGPTQLILTSPHRNSSTNRDSSILPSISSSNKNDNVLLQNLRTASNTTEVFELVNRHHSVMNDRHIMQALLSIFEIHKAINRNQKSRDISKDKEFLRLCEMLKKKVRFLELRDAMTALKIVSYMNVPSTSIITQSLLQLIRHSVNQLSLQNIMFLDFLMRNFEKTPLVEALKMALPIVFEAQLSTKLNRDCPQTLAECLWYLIKNDGNKKDIASIIEALQPHVQNIDLKTSKSLVFSLATLRYLPPGYYEILFNAQDVLAKNMTKLSFHEVHNMLRTVTNKVAHSDLKFYHEAFMDACARAVVSEDWGFEEGIHILSKLTYIGHTQIRLLDYLAVKCFENPNVLKQCPVPLLMRLVAGLAAADYKPIFWESMREVVISNKVLENTNRQLTWITFALDLASLDCYCPKLLEAVFNEDYLYNNLSEKTPSYLQMFLFLYQSVRTQCSDYRGPWPPKSMLDCAMQTTGRLVEEPCLLPALQKAMGGPQYVQSNLRTKLGHFIDYVVVMRKGGYPVAMNALVETFEDDPPVYIEDLKIPLESQVISIVNMPPYAYAINSQRLKGQWALYLKTLEAHLSHTVIPIRSTMWTGLPDHEKIPYLMQAISLKYDDIPMSENLR